MSLGKSALRRYKVIDLLLRNSFRRYPTMLDIIEACHDKLDYRPSEETIQKDIANMKLSPPDGFAAPIRYNRTNRGYEYTDPNYTLAGVSLLQEELDAIFEAVDIIRSIGGSRIGDKFNYAVEKILFTTLERSDNEDENLSLIHI